ncbi:FkbM family methyltransferase [Hahella ganghwensis]|uniref:FkbM family methyltransferase n=1 Tax=Hahella ganghwensis TaxID=286420 RepID=UPI000382E0B7|nr:FkbM family methyltransferase [Hahella ganghwensis]
MNKLFLLVTNPALFVKKLFERIRRFYRLHIAKDEFTVEAARWFADKGDETLRLNYPSLNQDSVVLDLGGYVGDFAYEINKKYGCKVYVFEPHPDFYERCVHRFADNKNIMPLNFGIADENGFFLLSDSVDGSSFLNRNHQKKQGVECEIREFFSVLSDLDIEHVDLMKINIEGGEYPLLKHIADKDKLTIVEEYQIQFHNFIKGAISKRNSIVSALSKTHKRVWCYTFVWENWKKI